jgi:hypothetical protein
MKNDNLKTESNNANVLLCEGLFGTYRIPLDPNETATYTCPANIKMEEIEGSHDNYFGYNIRRVISTLSKYPFANGRVLALLPLQN